MSVPLVTHKQIESFYGFVSICSHHCKVKVLARAQRKEGGNVNSMPTSKAYLHPNCIPMTTSEELRLGKGRVGHPLCPLAKTLKVIQIEHLA